MSHHDHHDQAAGHDMPHEGPVKTPKQLVAAVVASFVIPIVAIILLVNYVSTQPKEGAGTAVLDAQAVAARIAPVGTVEVRDASNPATVIAIGLDAAEKPLSVFSGNLALDFFRSLEYGVGLIGKMLVLGHGDDVGQWPSHITRDYPEDVAHRGCEETDVQVSVKEDSCDIGAKKDILQVIGSGALTLERLLQLIVHCRKFFVQRLEFLL